MQFFLILTLVSIGITPIGNVQSLLKSYGHYAWWAVLIAYGINMITLMISVHLCERFPDQTIIQWSKVLLGRWIGSVYGVLLVIEMLIWGYQFFMKLWHLTTYTQLPLTHSAIVATATLLVVVYSVSRGIEAWARFATIITPLVLLMLSLVNIPQFFMLNVHRLLPLWGPIDSILDPKHLTVLFLFRPVMILFFLYPYVKKEPGKSLKTPVLMATTIGAVHLLMAIIFPIGIFGIRTAVHFTFPYQESLETVAFERLPIEKISFLSPVLWLLITMVGLILSLYCSMKGIRQISGFKSEYKILAGVGLIAWLIYLFPVTTEVWEVIQVYWSAFGLLLFQIIPTMLWLFLKVGGK
nr:GerAB/ArcD/ProY family transporter [Paenibacillus swuensis]